MMMLDQKAAEPGDNASTPTLAIGRYHVRSRLGLGGMGEVYLATAVGPEGVQKPVAIKLIRQLHQQNQDVVGMFIEEAKVSFLLTHPNIVQTYEIGQVEGHYFLVMEYVDGTNLEELVGFFASRLQQPLPAAPSLYIASQVARGLSYAHTLEDQQGRRLNIVHRDVSPSNVLLSKDGLVKLSDFGLAKSTLRRVESRSGQIKGKLAYMAPEQLRGEEADSRADIYALGVMLYEMLSGANPFGQPNAIDIGQRLKQEKIQPLGERAPHLEPEVVVIVEQCTATEPADRFASARELQQRIDDCMRKLKLSVSDYELAEFITRARREAESRPHAPHPFDRALGMELKKVAGEAGASTFIKVPTDDDGSAAPAVAETALPPPERRSSRWLVLLMAAAVAMGVGLFMVLRRPVEPSRAIERKIASVELAADSRAKPDVRPNMAADAGRTTATLNVRSVPEGAAVFVGGKLRGTTPLSLSGVQPNRPIPVRIRLSGYRLYEQQVTLEPGGYLDLRPKLQPIRARAPRAWGTLSVNSEPWSIVYLDGKRIRSTPLLGYKLAAGQHKVRLVNPAKKLQTIRKVIIRPDRETRLSVELAR